jgi:hypothetical protein
MVCPTNLTALARLEDHPFHVHIYGAIEDGAGVAGQMSGCRRPAA